MAQATVSNIVKELAASGVLQTSPSTRSGRRAQHITLAHAVGLVVGVHISQRHMRVMLSDVNREVLAENHMPLAHRHRADNELDKASLLLVDMLESGGHQLSDVLAIGLAIAAPVRTDTGLIAADGLLSGWDGVAIADVLQRRLSRPVYVHRAADAIALAEWRHGAAMSDRHSIVLDIGQGISSGLILNGQPYRGNTGIAGELGHVRVRDDGLLCRCGKRGCLDTVAAGPAILSGVNDDERHMKLTDVVARALAGDAMFVRTIADAGRDIGRALADVCTMLDLESVVVGGELARAGELLLGPIRFALESGLIVRGQGVPVVRAGVLGDRAAVLGATIIAIGHTAKVGEAASPW